MKIQTAGNKVKRHTPCKDQVCQYTQYNTIQTSYNTQYRNTIQDFSAFMRSAHSNFTLCFSLLLEFKSSFPCTFSYFTKSWGYSQHLREGFVYNLNIYFVYLWCYSVDSTNTVVSMYRLNKQSTQDYYLKRSTFHKFSKIYIFV